MLDGGFEIPLYFDYGATFLWAVSGALLAGRRGYDVSGVLGIALVSATGGGLIRDGVFLQGAPPVLVRTPVYLALVTLAVLLVLAVGKYLRDRRVFADAVAVVDALGLGAYAVMGMQLAATKGMSPIAVALVGVVNAVGGGLLRDVLMRQEPEVFKPGALQGLAALAGCVVYLVLTRTFQIDPNVAGWATIATAFLARMASVRYRLTTRPIKGLAAELPPPGPKAE